MDEPLPSLPINAAVLTVSDMRGLASDRSGQILQERLELERVMATPRRHRKRPR